MKIPFAILSAVAVLHSAGVASAQATYSPPRPQSLPWMQGSSSFALIASSMNNYHPGIGNSAIATNSNAAMLPLLPPSLPTFRAQQSNFRTMPFMSVPSQRPTGMTPFQMRPR